MNSLDDIFFPIKQNAPPRQSVKTRMSLHDRFQGDEFDARIGRKLLTVPQFDDFVFRDPDPTAWLFQRGIELNAVAIATGDGDNEEEVTGPDCLGFMESQDQCSSPDKSSQRWDVIGHERDAAIKFGEQRSSLDKSLHRKGEKEDVIGLDRDAVMKLGHQCASLDNAFTKREDDSEEAIGRNYHALMESEDQCSSLHKSTQANLCPCPPLKEIVTVIHHQRF